MRDSFSFAFDKKYVKYDHRHIDDVFCTNNKT